MAKVLGYEVQGEEWWEVRLQARPGQGQGQEAGMPRKPCSVDFIGYRLLGGQ